MGLPGYITLSMTTDTDAKKLESHTPAVEVYDEDGLTDSNGTPSQPGG
jgi:hypothetical protein